MSDLSTTTIDCSAGFFQNDTTTPETVQDLQSTVNGVYAQVALAAADAAAAAASQSAAALSALNAASANSSAQSIVGQLVTQLQAIAANPGSAYAAVANNPSTSIVPGYTVPVTLGNLIGDFDLVRAYNVPMDGVTDCTTALQAMLNAWSAGTVTGPMVLPPNNYVLNGNLTVTVHHNQTFILTSMGVHGARFLLGSGFSGTALTITTVNDGPDKATSGAVTLENLTFVRTGGTGGNGILVTYTGVNPPTPGCYLRNIHFEADTGATWNTCCQLFNQNLFRVKGFSAYFGSSLGTALVVDANAICVDFDIEDFYVNGGLNGLLIGPTNPSNGSLQGCYLRRGSFTGTVYPVTWNMNFTTPSTITGAGSLTMDDCQVSPQGGTAGIAVTGLQVVQITNTLFLGGNPAISATGCVQTIISDNVFYGGSYTGTSAINLQDCEGNGANSGNIIANNVFTADVVAAPHGAQIALLGATDYTMINGNFCLNVTLVYDGTGSTHNYFGLNAQNGQLILGSTAAPLVVSAPTSFNQTLTALGTLAVGTGTAQTTITSAAGNLVLNTPNGGNVSLSSGTNLEFLAPNGSDAVFMGAANGGILDILASQVVLSSRPGHTDNPGITFAGTSGGLIGDVAGNLVLTPPTTSANVIVAGAFGLKSIDGTATNFQTINDAGDITVNTAGVMLAQRPGFSGDTPGYGFATYTGGTQAPAIRYNSSTDKFTITNKNGTVVASIDLNGNARFLGTVTGSVTP